MQIMTNYGYRSSYSTYPKYIRNTYQSANKYYQTTYQNRNSSPLRSGYNQVNYSTINQESRVHGGNVLSSMYRK